MGSSSRQAPPAPTLAESTDPRFSGGIDSLFEESEFLRSLEFGDHPLQQTIDTSPQVTDLALQFAQGSLTPAFNRNRQNSLNQLAQSGSIGSSTQSDAFAQQDFDLNSQLQAITAQAGLQDRERALQNRVGLFNTGLQTLDRGTQAAFQNQNFLADFNQQSFENQLAISEYERSNKGGLSGAITGGIGGALLGAALIAATGGLAAPAVAGAAATGIGGLGFGAAALGGGALGGLAGGFGDKGTGGQLLSAGGTFAGAAGSLGSFSPGSTAGVGSSFVSPFNGSGPQRSFGGFSQSPFPSFGR